MTIPTTGPRPDSGKSAIISDLPFSTVTALFPHVRVVTDDPGARARIAADVLVRDIATLADFWKRLPCSMISAQLCGEELDVLLARYRAVRGELVDRGPEVEPGSLPEIIQEVAGEVRP